MTPSVNAGFTIQTRKDLEYVWDVDDLLFQTLREEDLLYTRPIALRHPFVFYALHLPAFAVRLINLAKPGLISKHEFDELYARGIDPPADECSPHIELPYPSWKGIQEYKSRCRNGVLNTLNLEAHSPDLLHALRLVVEHDLMHHETLRYMMCQTRLAKVYELCYDSEPSKSCRVRVKQGVVIPGAEKINGYLARLDNEHDLNPRHVEPFYMEKYAVTNADYLQFIEAGGYTKAELWGVHWDWVERLEVTMPATWRRSDAGYQVSYMPTEQDDEGTISERPVLVSIAEAAAYARWKGARLPMEEEWVRAAVNKHVEPKYDRGWQPVQKCSEAWSGVVGLCGNGWEITSSMFESFEGFEPSTLYPEYSADFFDGNHHLLKGASPHTDPLLFRSSFRNFFQPCYRFVFAKFRLVWDGPE
ncbi:unnamed protein product [Agarophyton chilense]|eukprot:gb/GEZJ01003115.1/.p1 GENE.gb/GEZJ01003115.1/~~gb/GEZJ01003115.1/.p1  ORF type:complete len:417 (-),score=44.32 gb/GEZJ01003115.1/:2294-3544(-)